MVDPAHYQANGLDYVIQGLGPKGGALTAAQAAVDGLIHSRRERANAVLQSAAGPWAVAFREKEGRVLSALANAWFFLGYCADACRAFPEPSYYGGSPTSIGTAVASKSELVQPLGDGSAGTVQVQLDALSSYITEAQGQHETSLAHLFDHVNHDGLSGQRSFRITVRNSPYVPPSTVPLNVENLTPGEVAGQVPFLRHDPIDLIGMSNEVLQYAADRKTKFVNAGNRRNNRGGGGHGGHGGHDAGGAPPTTGPSPTTEPPPTEPALPVLEALTLVAGSFALLDRPGTDGTPADGQLTRAELAAAAQNTALPPQIRAAAAQIAADPELFAAVAVVNQPLVADVTGQLQFVTADDVTTFLHSVDAVTALHQHVAAVDLPGPAGQPPDGVISPEELRAAADNPQLDPEAREAAQFLLHHPIVTQRLAHYDALLPSGGPIDPESLVLPPVLDPATGQPVVDPATGRMKFEVAGFKSENLERLAADYGELLGTGDDTAVPNTQAHRRRPDMTLAKSAEPAVAV